MTAAHAVNASCEALQRGGILSQPAYLCRLHVLEQRQSQAMNKAYLIHDFYTIQMSKNNALASKSDPTSFEVSGHLVLNP